MHLRIYSILLFCLIALTSCDYFTSYTWNYRITIEIETPEGVKTGSAVRQIVARLNPPLNPDVSRVVYHVFGEAAVVELGERGKVFFLISDRDVEMFQEAFPYAHPNTKVSIESYSRLKSGKTGVVKKYRPKMVTFKDMSDPKSIKPVYYGKMYEALGQGVEIKSITVQVTDEPVTWESGQWLPDGAEKLNIGYNNFKNRRESDKPR